MRFVILVSMRLFFSYILRRLAKRIAVAAVVIYLFGGMCKPALALNYVEWNYV
jgi:hypothetical protein